MSARVDVHQFVVYCRRCDRYVSLDDVFCAVEHDGAPACMTDVCPDCLTLSAPCIVCGAYDGDHDPGCAVVDGVGASR